ncbi:FAD-binding oxidoreductase [Prochlorococcus sp. MIT 1307]|uniref:FAD-binding oxidoreductase n=1 Tax=Prochlorococcus sp. MIT 1307 TaxID=3096219 RepID=UPI002A74FB8E|nr:FAD-binding protein [Prochlorococcus sp. MIT 1307]
MEEIHSHLSVQNSVAQDCLISGVYKDVNSELIYLLKQGEITPKPLMVCSGGTSSRCAADGHWILDLRENYQQVNYNIKNKTVEVGAGVTMAKLQRELGKYNRSFPIGLSGLPGLGYILMGGISPLSRSHGLAVDQILNIKGIWGNGDPLNISKPTNASSYEEKLIWRGLCGAAPFLGIITKLILKTQDLSPLKIWQVYLEIEQLSEAIKQAENWPSSLSLQWIWGNKIKVYVIIKSDINLLDKSLQEFEKEFPCSENLEKFEVLGLQEMPSFNLQISSSKHRPKMHSEVLSLLGPPWENNCTQIVKLLENMMAQRPNEDCYIAAQQLGGVANQVKRSSTSFIHRQAIWKPWINASWRAGNQKDREQSLNWLKEVWEALSPYCPGVHLAQMHQHLPWHDSETSAAFEEWLPTLQKLKSRYDPECMLPRL